MGEQARPLLLWIMKLDSMSHDVCLWIPKYTKKLTLDTLCTPVVSPELKEQRTNHTETDLMKALNDYWENDAFNEIGNA